MNSLFWAAPEKRPLCEVFVALSAIANNTKLDADERAVAFFNLIRLAATTAKDIDVRAWSLLYGGIVALTLDDAKTADWFYKRFVRMRHPQVQVSGWFNCEAYGWFKRKFYDDERHAVPLRVPERMTKAKFSKLTVGK